ncbi:MAG TPA: SCO family protein [Crenotrichaceae bacterium]|nr:SCO family protein [Crenotrichaceae bacterium]
MNKLRQALFTRPRVLVLIILSLVLGAGVTQPIAANKFSSIQNQQNDKPKYYTRTRQTYVIPEMILVNQHGKNVHITELLNNDQPVLLQFVFTTCATICPVLSATFASAQQSLQSIATNYRMVSISIDPEQDTSQTLQEYANRFKASAQWTLLTGTRDQIARLQRAFNAYYPGNNKMYHLPYTYLRAANSSQWVRLEGLLSTQNLIEEYQQVVSHSMQ